MESLKAEPKNGVYLLEVSDAYEGYAVRSASDHVMVTDVKINGNYVAVSESMEVECDDFEVTDGDVLNLHFTEKGSE